MATAIAAWASAERRIFQYLLEATQSIVGVTGFAPEDVPRKMLEGETQMWTFKIEGDSPFAQTPQIQTRPNGCWTMGAMWTAQVERDRPGQNEPRKLAQDLCGMVLNALPVTSGEITSVGYVSWAGMPTIEPDIVEKGDTGYDVRIWRVTLPMWVKFGNSDYEG